MRKRAPKRLMGGKKPISHKMWEYIRRNGAFRPRDLITILEIKQSTVKSFIHSLEIAGFIIAKKAAKQKLDSVYTLHPSKKRCAVCPKVNSKEVYCFVTRTSVDIGARALLRKALKESSQGEVAKRLGVSKTTVNLLLHKKYQNPKRLLDKIRETL